MITLDPQLAARGYALRHLAATDSTNIEAKSALREGADRLWIVADSQNAGRGRHARDWVSPPGNLYASIALREPAGPANLPLLGFVAGVAVVESILALAPDLAPRLALKWPNDVLLDGAKAVGILLEGETPLEGAASLVIGIGVNVATFPQGLERPAIALASAASWLTRDALFSSLQRSFAEALDVFERGRGFSLIRARWLALSLPMGQRLSVKLPSGTREGLFAGLDAGGALQLECAGQIETILAGDVFVSGS